MFPRSVSQDRAYARQICGLLCYTKCCTERNVECEYELQAALTACLPTNATAVFTLCLTQATIWI